jgi:hypothetical protein
MGNPAAFISNGTSALPLLLFLMTRSDFAPPPLPQDVRQ